MFSSKTTFTQHLENRHGQIALFVALVFQVLFLFFAMIINVGLLVHHKINLQNSVDLAAYYGAMRQAEGMNVIAHTNYQIRQSYKLLVWRYRMLGSAGEMTYHPYKKTTPHRLEEPLSDTVSTTQPVAGYQEAPPFCIAYVPFKEMPPNENTCKNMASLSKITVFEVPPLIAGHETFTSGIISATEIWRERLFKRCEMFGSYNYYLMGKFLVAFNFDQAERMYLISLLSQGLSYSASDFYDIDGKLASTGIANTLRKNLTTANNNSDLTYNVYNSLGAEGCNANTDSDQPAKWLSTVKIYPGFRYIDTNCNQGGNRIEPVVKELSGNLNDMNVAPAYWKKMSYANEIEKLSKFIGFRSNLNDTYNYSLGVEKNPWCMAYVGVSATSKPKIPFSPFGAVTLKARAFYKPFGGRIGPWYREGWTRGSGFSNQGDKVDAMIPPRISDINNLAAISADAKESATRAANHSRFVGDKYGLKTWKMLGYYGRAIFEMNEGWKGASANNDGSYDTTLYQNSQAPSYADWDDIPFNFTRGNGAGDILAWNKVNNAPSKMRNLELLAVLPDTFDMAYYSIQPNFYASYFDRLNKGFLAGPGNAFKSNGNTLRPDIGYHKDFKSGQHDYTKFSIKDQYQAINASEMPEVVNQQFTFLSKDWRHVLTGWAGKDLIDYSLNTDAFGKCADSEDPNPATSGNCVVGGSTGYSVKMVSGSYLKSEIPNLGGQGANGAILNPPPSDF